MKKTSRWFFASVIGGAAFWANASMNYETIDDFGLLTISETEMSSIRGGFVSINDTIINIGLSISTALNGETVFSSYIADLTINNGVLTSSLPEEAVKPVSIVQNGGDGSNQAPTTINIDTGSIASIIQNTVDNTTIRVETQLDIQADVNSYLERQVIIHSIENSILYSTY